MKKIKVGTVCSGVGCPEQALRNLGIPFEVAYYCELDRFASASYRALHEPQAKNLGDLTTLDLDSLPYVDLLVGGTPCQDFSVAGKGAGGEEGSGTRSSLMWNFLKIIEKTKTHWVLWENVKNACGKGNRDNFDKFLNALRDYGYAVSYKVLNAKDYTIPQNRERVFVVGELNGKNFVFPPKQPLKLRLKDMLEDVVDEKYYLSKQTIQMFINHTNKQKTKGNGFKFEPSYGDGNAKTISTRAGWRSDDNFIIEQAKENEAYGVYLNESKRFIRKPLPELSRCLKALKDDAGVVMHTDKLIQAGYLSGGVYDKMHEQSRRVYDTEGIAPTIHVCGGVNQEPKILQRPHGYNKGAELDHCPMITANNHVIKQSRRIRKLTPRECWRLMGWTDEQFDKAKWYTREESEELLRKHPNHKGKRQFSQEGRIEKMSDSQLYKQAGNGIVIQVLEVIFRRMFLEQAENSVQPNPDGQMEFKI